jgi:glycosyltransferase involved in cell wall biosynthesis
MADQNAVKSTTILHVAAVEFTASRLLRPQLHFLQQQGYRVRLACAPLGDKFVRDLQDFDPIPIAFPRSLDPLSMAKASYNLLGVVRNLQPDLVHFHTPAASLPGRLLLAPLPRRPKIVYTVHGFPHMWDTMTSRDRILHYTERLLSRWTDALLFQSREDYEHAQRAGYHGRLEYLGNGVAEEWFYPGARRMRAGPFRAVFVGRLIREKGIQELLWVVQNVPEVHWTIVGDALPTDRDSLSAEVSLVAALSGGRVERVGMVPPEGVRQYLADADVLVLPSWREGVPRSIIEAMAVGVPVIATDVRGCRELVTPGINGWLVRPRRASELAAAVREAASLSGDQLVAMGAAGQSIAREHYREVDVFRRIEQAYHYLGVSPR